MSRVIRVSSAVLIRLQVLFPKAANANDALERLVGLKPWTAPPAPAGRRRRWPRAAR